MNLTTTDPLWGGALAISVPVLLGLLIFMIPTATYIRLKPKGNQVSIPLTAVAGVVGLVVTIVPYFHVLSSQHHDMHERLVSEAEQVYGLEITTEQAETLTAQLAPHNMDSYGRGEQPRGYGVTEVDGIQVQLFWSGEEWILAEEGELGELDRI